MKVTDFIFLGSKITADDDCSHEIKRYRMRDKNANSISDEELVLVYVMYSYLYDNRMNRPFKHVERDVRVGP